MTGAAPDKMLEDFVNADTAVLRTMLETNPELLSEASATRLDEFSLQMTDPAASEALAWSASLIRNCLSHGIGPAFAELSKSTNRVSESSVHTEIAQLLGRIGALSNDVGAAPQVIALCDAVLQRLPKGAQPELWAAIQGERANSLSNLGRARADPAILGEAIGGYDLALTVRQLDLHPADWGNTQHNRASAFQSLGELSGDTNHLKEAIAGYDAALKVRTLDANPAKWALTQSNRASTYLVLGEQADDAAIIRQAVALFDQVLAVSAGEPESSTWGLAHHNRANGLLTLGERADDPSLLGAAVAGFDAALTMRSHSKNGLDWASTHQCRAIALLRLGQLSHDFEYLKASLAGFDLALEEFTRKASPGPWSTVQQNRANVLLNLGRLAGDPTMLRAAVAAFDLALEVRVRATNPMDWASTQQNRANALQLIGWMVGDPDELKSALSGYDSALQVLSREAHPADWATTQQNRANSLLRLGELLRAPVYLRAALKGFITVDDVLSRSGNPSAWAKNQHNRANALWRLGQADGNPDLLVEAVYALDAALSVHSRENNPSEWAASTFSRANQLLVLGQMTGATPNLDEIVEAYRQALVVFSTGEAADQRMACQAALARLLLVRESFDEARTVLDSALDSGLAHLLSLNNRLARERAVTQAAGLAELRGWIAVAIDEDATTALLCLERGRAQLLALEVAEDSREAFVSDTAALADLVQAIPSGGAVVLPIITPVGSRVAVIPAGREEVSINDFLDLPALTRDLLESWFYGPSGIPTASGGYVGAHHDLRAGNLGAVYSQVGPIGKSFSDHLQETLEAVWEQLLGPVDARLRALGLEPDAPVIIVPPGLLSMLPLWAAAPDMQSGNFGEPFGARWTVSLSPSLNVLRVAGKRVRSWQGCGGSVSVLAVLDPASNGQFRLSGAALEGELLASSLPGEQLITLTGPDATAGAVHKSLQGRSHLHLAAHGVYAPHLPDESAVLLAGDDRVTLGELRQLDPVDGLRLVILSACDTGLPGLQRGRIDEFIGLPTGFIKAGAAAVIASHWQVRDDAAFFLMWKFYEEYLDRNGRTRVNPADALRSASLWLRSVSYGTLGSLFEPVRTADGSEVPRSIDRSRPRRMNTGVKSNATVPGAIGGSAQASDNARSPVFRRVMESLEPLFTPAEHEAISANPAAYVLGDTSIDWESEQPFADPIHWAAFSITGI